MYPPLDRWGHRQHRRTLLHEALPERAQGASIAGNSSRSWLRMVQTQLALSTLRLGSTRDSRPPARRLAPQLFKQAANHAQRSQSSCIHAPVQTCLVTPSFLNGSSTLPSCWQYLQSSTRQRQLNPLRALTLVASAAAYLADTIRKPSGHTCCHQLNKSPSRLVSILLETCSDATHVTRIPC